MTFEWCLNTKNTYSPHTGACEEGVCDTPLPCRPAASAGIKKAEYMQRMSPHVTGFLGWRPQTPRGLGKCQNTPLNVSEGSEGTPAKLAGYIKRVPGFLRRRPASPEAGKLAGYLKSPYQANFAGVRRRPGRLRFSFLCQPFDRRRGIRRLGLSAASAMIRRQSSSVRSAGTTSFGSR